MFFSYRSLLRYYCCGWQENCPRRPIIRGGFIQPFRRGPSHEVATLSSQEPRCYYCLTAHTSWLSKKEKDFTTVEEANTHLELEVKRLKQIAEKDKAALVTLQEELGTVKEEVGNLKLERGSLARTLAHQSETFSKRGKEISLLLST